MGMCTAKARRAALKTSVRLYSRTLFLVGPENGIALLLVRRSKVARPDGDLYLAREN